MGADIYVLSHNWHYCSLYPNSIYAERSVGHTGGCILSCDYVHSIRLYCTSKYYNKSQFTGRICSRYLTFYYNRVLLLDGATDRVQQQNELPVSIQSTTKVYLNCNLRLLSWKVELKKKQHDSSLTDKSITILLHNLLPTHVGRFLGDYYP